MIRTQISLTPDQMRQAQAEARRRGISVAELVRLGLQRIFAEAAEAEARERAKRSTGGFRSGHRDTSADHDEALAAADRW